LLDQDQANEIAQLKAKVKPAEDSKALHSKFAALMDQGTALSNTLSQAVDFSIWLVERDEWKKRVSKAFDEMNLPTEAAAFLRAAEDAPRMTGVFDVRNHRAFLGEEMALHRRKLEQIVDRRLP
jgi:hypothetical protein